MTTTFKLRHALYAGLAVVLTSTASFALGTDDQRAACTPDVFRLCSSEIPSVDRIVACLKKQRTSLSPGCQAVFKTDQQSASRSLETPATEWCSFGSIVNPAQSDWLKWCRSSTKPN